MQSSIQIRTATIADLEQILAFIQQKADFDGFRDPVIATVDSLSQTLFGEMPGAEVAFAEIDQNAVGFVLFSQMYSSFLAQPTIWIDDLFVQAEWRRQGIGTALLQYIAQIAKRRNCGRIEWTVATRNDSGVQFYQQQGAQIRETVRLCRMNTSAIDELINAR
ncbi:MAG: GNAT family N-acetyltransferase [Leptolyngbyaceae cyanobacterium bins.302]|nr:GNAT family N-acetyltransferase [Leptolyngbyaceae cyanobacterium bins.302]